MKQPSHFEIFDTHACFAPEGFVTLDDGVKIITQAIQFCRHQNISRLLVNTTLLVGFPPPMIHERYWFAKEWAHASRGGVIVSLVAREELIDPQKFGVIVAQNNGMKSHVTTDEKQALDWLLAQKLQAP